MKIIKEKTKYHTYALESEYSATLVEFCQYLKKTLGWKEFNWDMENKKWRFKDPQIIGMIKEKFHDLLTDDYVKKEYEDYINKVKFPLPENEKILTLEIENIKGNLYGYQKEGVAFLVNSGGRALLADSPGVGKTLQTLGYIIHSKHKKNLIICPASVKFSWENEIKQWTDLKSFVVNPKTNIKDIPLDTNCVIINYDILKKFYADLVAWKFDCMVADECHLIKSRDTIRTKVAKEIAKQIPHVIMLTGTPVLSRPVEIFNVLSILDRKTWKNFYEFAMRYCDGKQNYWGFEAKGATNLPELKERIKKYFLRRTKDEVLKELPPKNFIEIPMDMSSFYRKQYDLIEENLVKFLRENKFKTDKEIARSLQGEKLVKINLLRQTNALSKIDTAIELIDNILEADEKVLVFSGFNQSLVELHEKYKDKSVLLIGATPIEERGIIVNKFQTDPETKIFFAGIKSGGVGITLTAASNVIILDYPFNPADLEQSINRAHRPGAEYESLNIYQITSRNSIDGFLKKLLKYKQDIIDQLIDGKEIEVENNMIDEYIKELELKYK